MSGSDPPQAGVSPSGEKFSPPAGGALEILDTTDANDKHGALGVQRFTHVACEPHACVANPLLLHAHGHRTDGCLEDKFMYHDR